MEKITPTFDPVSYFNKNLCAAHKRFLALRSFFVDKKTAPIIAKEFDYAITTVYAMIRDFKKTSVEIDEDPFFKQVIVGRKKIDREGDVADIVVSLRKRNLSVPEIKAIIDSKGMNITERRQPIFLRWELGVLYCHENPC